MAWKPIDGQRVFAFDYPFTRDAKATATAIVGRPGELIVLSPPRGLTDADFAEIEEQGRPVALVATNGFHHLGLPEWHRRYPDAKLFAPLQAARRIARKQPGLPAFEPLHALSALCPAGVEALEPPGMRIPDVVARVSTPKGWLYSFNDIVMNLTRVPPGLLGKVFEWTGSAPGFKVARFFTLIGVKDKKAFKRWLLAELSKAPPALLTTAHGAPVLEPERAMHLPEMVEAAV
jgi:hypothetical protein